MRMLKLCGLSLMLIALSFTFVQAQNLKGQAIPSDPSVRMGTLPNGMKYYLKKNQKPENRVEFRLAVNAGSMQEDEDQLGLAHFVEHMAFNGTKNFKKNELVDYLESVGTRFGPDLNAYTSFDETVYMLQARTDDDELLNKGLLIMQDWAGGLLFDGEEIDKERGVVVSEWRTRLSPDQRMQQKYFPIMYQGARYAERLPIGKPEIIQGADYETVKRFYKDWYRPNLMAFIAVGDFDLDWMENEIKSRFSSLQNPTNERKREEYKVPGHKETLFAITSDKEAPFTTVRLMYKHNYEPSYDLEGFRKGLMTSLYNRMVNARLYELQQSSDPPFTFAYVGYGQDVGDLATYTTYAFVPEGGALAGLEAVMKETRRAQLHGFNESELERQKVEMLKAAEKTLKEQDKTESGRMAMAYVYNFLDNNPIPSPQQRYELMQQLLPTISVNDINPLPKKWITDENKVVVVTGPDKEETPLPTEADLAEVVSRVEKMEVEAYIDQVSDEPLLATNLKATTITEEVSYDELGINYLKLENGIQVYLKQTDFKNDEILMNAFSPGGHSLYDDSEYRDASSAAGIVNASGIGNFSVTELEKKLAGKTVNVSPYISERYEGLRGNCSPDDVETMFQLAYLYFNNIRKDETALLSYQKRQKSIMKNILTNPYYYFGEEKNKLKYGDHPRRRMQTVEELDKLNLDKIYQVYEDRFADASDFTFVFVGNFEMESFKKHIATYLGNLPNKNREESWKDTNVKLKDGQINKTITKGKAPKALVEMFFHGDFDFKNTQKRYNFYSMIDLLRIKMRESMREDKGGVYGVRVSGFVGQYPESNYRITISFNCEPEKADELIETAWNDIKNAQANGAEEKDLTKVKETQKQGRIKNLKENRYWSGQINSRVQNGLPLEGITLEAYQKLMEGLNSNAIKTAAGKYFDKKNYKQFILQPEEQPEN